MKHTLAVLVENHPGVLFRVSGLFARRGYNIESLAVSTTEYDDISRMTIVVEGDEYVLEQVVKQLNKLIDVIKVWDITRNALSRELALIKVRCNPENLSRLLQISQVFRSRVLDMSSDSVVLEITGSGDKIDALERLLTEFGILEMTRTGSLALERGSDSRMKLKEDV